MSKPLTAEEIADLPKVLPPVARGDTVQLCRDDYDRARNLVRRAVDELVRARAVLRILDGERAVRGLSVSTKDVGTMLDEVERASTLLKRIEWGRLRDECPACGGPMEHRAGCELAALIGGRS